MSFDITVSDSDDVIKKINKAFGNKIATLINFGKIILALRHSGLMKQKDKNVSFLEIPGYKIDIFNSVECYKNISFHDEHNNELYEIYCITIYRKINKFFKPYNYVCKFFLYKEVCQRSYNLYDSDVLKLDVPNEVGIDVKICYESINRLADDLNQVY